MTRLSGAGFDGLGALFAASTDEDLNIRSLIARQPKLCARLAKFDVLDLIQTLSVEFPQKLNRFSTPR